VKLEELLDELRRNLLRDVSDAVSVDQADLLWTDLSLVRYINEGYFRFCRRTHYLRDASTPEVCEVVLEEGVSEYPLHESVLKVLTASYGNLTLSVTSADEMLNVGDDSVGMQARMANNEHRSVSAVVPDFDRGTLKVVGTPGARDDGKTIYLRVSRLPLERLALDEPEREPEIPEHLQLDILEWAAFRALRNHDHDGENMRKASAHKTQFNEAVEYLLDEARDRHFVPAKFAASWRW